MTLGLSLVAATATMLVANARSAALNVTLSTLQTSGRHALDQLAAGLRSAGYQGCASSGSAPVADSSRETPLLSGYAMGFAAFRRVAGSWSPALPAEFSPPSSGRGAPLEGTDAVLVQSATDLTAVLRSTMARRHGKLRIEPPLDPRFMVDQHVLLTDCNAVDLFQISALNTNAMDPAILHGESLSRVYSTEPTPATVHGFESAIYYVGDSGISTEDGVAIPMLFSQSPPYDAANNPPAEVAAGVEMLRVQLNVRESDGTMTTVAPGDAGFDHADVMSVEVGLLLRSDRPVPSSVGRAHDIAGYSVSESGSGAATDGTYARDGRLRLAFSRAIALRNRAIEAP